MNYPRVLSGWKFAASKGLARLVEAAPFRLFLMEALAAAIGLEVLFLRKNEWKLIIRFARLTGSRIPAWPYLWKYAVQTGRNNIWGGTLFFEAGSVLNRYLTVENPEVLEEGLRQGSGAVILGAHYGPKIHLFLFRRMNLNFRHLVSREFYDESPGGVSVGNSRPASRKNVFFGGLRPYLVPRGSERDLVRHLRQGGVVSMLIDFPGREAGFLTADFFGFPMRFAGFPFRLALRYESPVFFYFLTRVKGGGYRLSFAPSGNFSTPAEGAAKYASFFQSKITDRPFPWHSLPSLMKWFPD